MLEGLTHTPEVPWHARAIGDAVKLLNTMIQNLSAITDEMQDAARDLRFEAAARLRDEIHELKRELRD